MVNNRINISGISARNIINILIDCYSCNNHNCMYYNIFHKIYVHIKLVLLTLLYLLVLLALSSTPITNNNILVNTIYSLSEHKSKTNCQVLSTGSLHDFCRGLQK